MSGHTMIQKTRGFTIIELMTAIAILSILAAIAIPSFNSLIKNNRLSSAANEVVSAIASARGEAIKRKTDVEISLSGSDWSEGILVKDATGDLYESSPFPNAITATAGSSSVTFTANGYTKEANPLGDNGLVICSNDIKRGRLVTLQRSGSVTVTNIDC